jgi:hypothetical protein
VSGYSTALPLEMGAEEEGEIGVEKRGENGAEFRPKI